MRLFSILLATALFASENAVFGATNSNKHGTVASQDVLQSIDDLHNDNKRLLRPHLDNYSEEEERKFGLGKIKSLLGIKSKPKGPDPRLPKQKDLEMMVYRDDIAYPIFGVWNKKHGMSEKDVINLLYSHRDHQGRLIIPLKDIGKIVKNYERWKLILKGNSPGPVLKPSNPLHVPINLRFRDNR